LNKWHSLCFAKSTPLEILQFNQRLEILTSKISNGVKCKIQNEKCKMTKQNSKIPRRFYSNKKSQEIKTFNSFSI